MSSIAPSTAAGASATIGELLGAFTFASDLAFGLQLEDGLRCCYLATKLAEAMGLSEEERTTVYYTALLKDAGCTCWTTEAARIFEADEIVGRRELLIFGDPSSMTGFLRWMRKNVAVESPRLPRLRRMVTVLLGSRAYLNEGFSISCQVAARIARRLGMTEAVQTATLNVFEHWDGKGAPRGLQGEQIPIAARLVFPTFVLVPIHRVGGRDAAIALAKGARGSSFDPAVVDAFLHLAQDESFWDGLESDGIQERVRSLEPDSPAARITEERLDDVALAFADYVDLKSTFAAAHSRRVAAIAEQLASLAGCAPSAVRQIRRAALMHDIGLVAVSSFALAKEPSRLSEAEKEQYRLHPYHAERILQRVPLLAPFAEMAGTHHERPDGAGYYRGLADRQISLGARSIAVADRLDELTHTEPGHAAMEPRQAIEALMAEAGAGYDPVILQALSAALAGNKPLHPPTPQRLPNGLTERELDVLRLAARGITRHQIAAELSIADSTVRHHLEHIYAKIGVTTRVGATLFAMENDLLT